jgi:hypothetical protein
VHIQVEVKKKRTAVTDGARAMAHARWAKIPAAKRRQIMQKVRAHGGGRKRDPDRCYCGAHTWHTATLRGFDCCKRAGKFP